MFKWFFLFVLEPQIILETDILKLNLMGFVTLLVNKSLPKHDHH
jgi:hypothetical protein